MADWDVGGEDTTDDRRFSVYAKIRGIQRRMPSRGPTAGPTAGSTAGPTVFALAALSLVAAACAGSSEATSNTAEPTFRRAAGSSITYEEPVANVADLLAPAAEGQPWLILGSVLDPGSGTTVASTWSADDVS